MSRPGRFLPWLLAVSLLPACVGREPPRPTVVPPSLEPGDVPVGVASSPPAAPAESFQSLFSGRRFSLMIPKLELPPAPAPAVPLDTPDPRYAAYSAVLKRRIEDKWVYPQEAARRGQSGRGEARVTVLRDGSVQTVEIVKSSGVMILDDAFEHAIRSAQPFPPVPASIEQDVLPISINFTYTLDGVRLFGF